MHNPQLFTHFIGWKGCFNIWKGLLWMTIMSLDMAMKLRLRGGGYIDFPIMFLSLGEL